MKINTLAVHHGNEENDPLVFPVPSLVTNSAVLLKSVEDGWNMLTNEKIDNIAYQRYANPTVRVLEKQFAAIEKCTYSLAVNSGMTACLLVFRSLLSAGDHIVTQHSLYHEISDQLKYDKKGCGITATFIKNYSVQKFKDAIRPNTKMVFVETPTNPAMYDVDIEALSRICKSHKIIFVVDNTLLSPIYQKPLMKGADITLYSTTKAINGHGDAMGGIISTNKKSLYKKIKSYRDNTGLIIDPFSAWNTIRGMRTLPLRLERHTQNARKVIAFLKSNYPEYPIVYPADCENSQQNGVTHGGGVISILLKNKEQGIKFIRSLKLIRIGTTFGNLESLCYHFGAFARPTRNIKKIGIPLGLVRLSIGIEDADDIIADINQALQKI